MIFNAPWVGWMTIDENFQFKVRDDAPEEVKKAYEEYMEKMRKEGIK